MGELGYLVLEELGPGVAFPGVIGRTTDDVEPGVADWATLPRQVPGVGMRWMRGYGR